MEESFLRCTRCLALPEDIPLTHIDDDGNIYCIKCANYLLKKGGYNLSSFNINEFLSIFKGEDKNGM